MKLAKIRDQRGVVSIMITMIMMLVISLIVIGFSQVARRNERESLDRQLSTQAYYAAESGVNAVNHYLLNPANATAQVDTLDSGDCKATDSPVALPNLSSANSVSTTCLMLNTQPTTLVADPVTQDSPIVFHVQDGTNSFSSLVFTWTPPAHSTGSYNCAATNTNGGITTLPVYTTTPGAGTPWDCAEGILRIDFVPVSTFTKAGLSDAEDNTKTVYFVPNASMAGQNTVDLSQATNAYLRKTKCATYSTTNTCATTGCGTSVNSTCAGIVTAGLGSNYYVRVSTLYKDAGSVTISATDATQVGGVRFVQGQAVIDSTGKAQDQYRRVQVRVPLVSTQSALPLFGVQSTSTICKQMSVAAGIYPASPCTSQPGV